MSEELLRIGKTWRVAASLCRSGKGRVVLRSGSSRVFLLGLGLLLGCTQARSRSEVSTAMFSTKAARRAETMVPDLHSQAKQAHQAAQQAHVAGDGAAAADHETRARLWLAAAVVEAERIEIERRRLRVLRQSEEFAGLAQHMEQSRWDADDEAEREAAAKIATQEAERAYAEAARAESKRASRGKKGGKGAGETYRQAQRFFAERARLLAAAATAMGASVHEADAVAESARRAESKKDESGLEEALRAYQRAQVLLGRVRAQRARPTLDEAAALRREAKEARFQVEQYDEGLVVRIPSLWRGGALDRESVRRMASLILAHPHGLVRLALGAEGGASRTESLKAALTTSGVDAKRLRFAELASSDYEAELLFIAYGVAPEATPNPGKSPPPPTAPKGRGSPEKASPATSPR